MNPRLLALRPSPRRGGCRRTLRDASTNRLGHQNTDGYRTGLILVTTKTGFRHYEYLIIFISKYRPSFLVDKWTVPTGVDLFKRSQLIRCHHCLELSVD